MAAILFDKPNRIIVGYAARSMWTVAGPAARLVSRCGATSGFAILLLASAVSLPITAKWDAIDRATWDAVKGDIAQKAGTPWPKGVHFRKRPSRFRRNLAA